MLIDGFDVPHVHIKMYPVLPGKPLEIHMGPEVDDKILETQAEKIKVLL
jgi:hypothetical protein